MSNSSPIPVPMTCTSDWISARSRAASGSFRPLRASMTTRRSSSERLRSLLDSSGEGLSLLRLLLRLGAEALPSSGDRARRPQFRFQSKLAIDGCGLVRMTDMERRHSLEILELAQVSPRSRTPSPATGRRASTGMCVRRGRPDDEVAGGDGVTSEAESSPTRRICRQSRFDGFRCRSRPSCRM